MWVDAWTPARVPSYKLHMNLRLKLAKNRKDEMAHRGDNNIIGMNFIFVDFIDV